MIAGLSDADYGDMEGCGGSGEVSRAQRVEVGGVPDAGRR